MIRVVICQFLWIVVLQCQELFIAGLGLNNLFLQPMHFVFDLLVSFFLLFILKLIHVCVHLPLFPMELLEDAAGNDEVVRADLKTHQELDLGL